MVFPLGFMLLVPLEQVLPQKNHENSENTGIGIKQARLNHLWI